MDTKTEPSGATDGSDDTNDGGDDGAKRQGRKRAGSSKRSKTQQLTIHETLKVAPKVPVPEGARFKGYRDFIVQDLRIQPHNTCYRLEVWQTPEGERLLGELPAALNGGHFGAQQRTEPLCPNREMLLESLCAELVGKLLPLLRIRASLRNALSLRINSICNPASAGGVAGDQGGVVGDQDSARQHPDRTPISA